MKYEIKHRWTGKIIYQGEAESFRALVVAAVGAGANLARAYLAGADLAGADLTRADLTRADLTGANLAGADLTRADLTRADLTGANLAGAYLAGAYLAGADLTRADLTRAYLAGADLAGADLTGAYLAGADLAGAKGISKLRTSPLYMLLHQVGKIRAYKLVNSRGEGPQYGGIAYKVGATVKVDADTDETTSCSYGINLATLDWCLREWREGYKIMMCEFTQKDVAAIPIGSDGKFRVSRCKVLREMSDDELGMIQEKKDRKEWEAKRENQA